MNISRLQLLYRKVKRISLYQGFPRPILSPFDMKICEFFHKYLVDRRAGGYVT